MDIKLKPRNGDLGWGYTCDPYPTFSQHGYSQPMNVSIAHDIIEHPVTHNPGHPGLQELEALGALWWFRYTYGIMLPGNYRRSIETKDIGSDVCNMFYLYEMHGNLANPEGAFTKTRIAPEIEGILPDVIEYCKEDGDYLEIENIDWHGFSKLVGQRMSIGLRKFRKRFAKINMWELADLFLEMYGLTHKLDAESGEEYVLRYSFSDCRVNLFSVWELEEY